MVISELAKYVIANVKNIVISTRDEEKTYTSNLRTWYVGDLNIV